MIKAIHIDTCPYCGSHDVVDCITEIQCLSCGTIESSLFDYPSAFDEGRSYPSQDVSGIEDRLSNLESMTSEAGSIPRKYKVAFQQLEGRVLHSEAKLQEFLSFRRKNKGQY